MFGVRARTGASMPDPALIRAIVRFYARGRKGWKYQKAKNVGERHRVFFIRRRAEWAHANHFGWFPATGSSATKQEFEAADITERLDNEVDAVDSYLSDQLGTYNNLGELFTKGATAADQHLDLVDVARVLTSHPEATTISACRAAVKLGLVNITQRRVYELYRV